MNFLLSVLTDEQITGIDTDAWADITKLMFMLYMLDPSDMM
jgi:hypothetical protein